MVNLWCEPFQPIKNNQITFEGKDTFKNLKIMRWFHV